VRALARRGDGGKPAALRLGDLSFDRNSRVARLPGGTLDLSAREAAFLELLLERAGRLVSREQLAARLGEWGADTSEMSLEVHAARLRRKLEPAGIEIVSVPALGFSIEKGSRA
jgi:two-component system OmpR family response regulator